MATVEEYVRMAEEAQADGAHVAVLTHYRTAIEGTGYNQNAAGFLLTAVQYAQRLKKEKDRVAIAIWSREALTRLQTPSLKEIIATEIAKLEVAGGKNATA